MARTMDRPKKRRPFAVLGLKTRVSFPYMNMRP